jgi:hypothetical protein
MKTVNILVVALVLLLSGCVSTEELMKREMDPWLGVHQSLLYQQLGPPNAITEDGNGGSILIYEHRQNYAYIPGEVVTQGNTATYTTPQTLGYVRSRMYYVNQGGIIYAYRGQGK